MDFHKARTVLLIFDGTDVSRLGRINKIIDAMNREGKDVTALAFYNDKSLADVCLTQDKIDFVSKSELTSFGFPEEHIIQGYFSNTYDLVLLLDMVYCETTAMMTDIADATFKAGKASVVAEDSLDLVIELKDDKDETFLVEQIKYYLRSIKSGS